MFLSNTVCNENNFIMAGCFFSRQDSILSVTFSLQNTYTPDVQDTVNDTEYIVLGSKNGLL